MQIFYSSKQGGFYNPVINHESVPIDSVEISETEYQNLLEGQSSGKYITADAFGHPQLADSPAQTIEQLAARKRHEMDAARDAALFAGLEYEIAGEPDVVQTRLQDQINLLGLSAKAQQLIASGDSQALLTFRGLSNVNRQITAIEMEALTLTALAHIEEIYQHSWERKDSIDSALASKSREDISAVTW